MDNSESTSCTNETKKGEELPEEKTLNINESSSDETKDVKPTLEHESEVNDPNLEPQIMAARVISAPKLCPAGHRIDSDGKLRRVI